MKLLAALVLCLIASRSHATPNWHKVKPDGALDCGTAYALAEACGPDCQAREHDQECDTLGMKDIDEPYQEPNPEYARQLQQLRDQGHLDDGSTVTTAPMYLNKTRKVRKLVEDDGKKAQKKAEREAEKAARKAEADDLDACKLRVASLKGKTLTAAERDDAIKCVLKKVF